MGAELGNYKSCVSARSTDKEILKHAQDGGIVTSLFGFALDEGIIDGAIVAATKEFAHKHPEKAMMDNSNMEFHEPWRPIPVIVTTKADLLAAAGTKYNISPNVSLIKEATRSFGLDKVGIVGTPCQMQAIRKGPALSRSAFVMSAPALHLQSVSSAWRTSPTRASSSSWKTTRQ